MAASECPARDDLAGYVAGTLPEEELDHVADHVDACPACTETVCRLEETVDSVLSRLRQPRPEDACFEDDACQQVIALLEGLGASAPPHRAGASSSDPPGAPLPLPCRIRGYELQELLGHGGMGTVYRAWHTQLHKTVAVKVLSADRLQDQRAVARFQREMRAIGRLEHPNIVRAMDAGEEAGTHFLVMEFIDGRDLSSLVAELGPFPVAEACEVIRQAAAGLQHIHEHGLVHRDIKPSNLILSQGGTVKLLDLGLALLADRHIESGEEMTSTGQIMGTIDYLAPEQGADTHRVDIRADLYSLGGTLYKLLTGQAPFAGPQFDSVLKKLSALAMKDPRAVQDFRPDVPLELAALVHNLLAKSPEHRPATPADVVRLLAPFSAGADLVALLNGKAPQVLPRVPAASEADLSPASSARGGKLTGDLVAAVCDVAGDGDREPRPAGTGTRAARIGRLIRRQPRVLLIGLVPAVLLIALSLSRINRPAAPTVDPGSPDTLARSGNSGRDISGPHGRRVPLEVEEPPPLDQWLAGRQVITVAQDGSADHTTINAALAALQPGQVVEVLDAGPYRERCEYDGMPHDIGLISRAGTVVEFGDWHEAEDGVRGHVFWHLNGCRFSGFQVLYDHHPGPGNAIPFHASGPGTTVLENCEFLGRGRLSDRPEGSGVYANCANGGLVVVRDCLFTGTLRVGPSRSDTTTLIHRNLFMGIDDAQLAIGGFAPGVHRFVVRDNVAVCGEPRGYGLFLQPLWPDRAGQMLCVANNTIVTSRHGALVHQHAPHEGVQIVNNVLGRDGIRLSELPGEDREQGLPRWDVHHNALGEQPPDATRYPASTATFTGDVPYLSTDPADDDFLRLPLDSPLATGGAGEGYPTYVGALAPGPAPPEGDWFSRLLVRWRRAQAVLGGAAAE